MSKKYSGENKQSLIHKMGTAMNVNTFAPQAQKRNSGNRNNVGPLIEVGVRASKVMPNGDYMSSMQLDIHKALNEGNKRKDQSATLNEQDSDDDLYIESVEEGENGDVIYKNRSKYSSNGGSGVSEVSKTPSFKTLQPESLVASTAGTVIMHKLPNNVKEYEESEAEAEVVIDNYCDVLINRYEWVRCLLKNGLKLSDLNDESLWALDNRCKNLSLDSHSYTKVLFQRYGSAMFDVRNWNIDG